MRIEAEGSNHHRRRQPEPHCRHCLLLLPIVDKADVVVDDDVVDASGHSLIVVEGGGQCRNRFEGVERDDGDKGSN